MSQNRPTLSWIPVRLFPAVLVDKTVTVEQWLEQAAAFGLPAVEIYEPFLTSSGRCGVDEVGKILARLGLRVSMVTASPDLTHPDADVRRREIAATERAVQHAAALQAAAVRCTTGQAHPGLAEQKGLELVVSGALAHLAGYARPVGVKIAVENHFRDRTVAELPDFAQRKDLFLKARRDGTRYAGYGQSRLIEPPDGGRERNGHTARRARQARQRARERSQARRVSSIHR